MSIANLITAAKGYHDRAANPDVFIDRYLDLFTDKARDLVWEIGRAEQPLDSDTEAWERRLKMMADMIRVERVGSSSIEISLDITDQPTQPALIEQAIVVVNGVPITREWVDDWVKAGDAGDDLGKDIDSRDDRNPGDYETIADRVVYALLEGKMSGESIVKYIMNATVAGSSQFIDLLLEAWKHSIIPLVGQSWLDHMQGRILVDAPF